MARVSVVMATYNNEQSVGEAIESILTQTFSDWELIVVDDRSTDNTWQVVRDYLADARVRCVRLPINSGSGAARNRAIGMTSADFVAIMDADDISLPARLQSQVLALDEDPSLAAVSSQVAEFGEWGGPVVGRWPTSDEQVRQRQKGLKMPVPHPASMFRTSEVLRVGGYDETCRRAQDYALFLRLSDRRVRCLPEVHVLYRTARPLPLEYAVRNGRYAALARTRYAMASRGVAVEALPTQPARSLLVDLGSVKSWAVRNVRERIGR
ncbi:glycosyltransferase family 2 protein [Rhodococcus indonesiensis]|uniref:glycosyltransferase family 2 protein n=1 Tax=Rhodococcus indonesiensis TaxID=3055869 RepID=UPI0034DFB72A